MVKIITNFEVLMKLAHLESEARKTGNKRAIEKAIEQHEHYRQLCLQADEMQVGITKGEL